MHMDLNGNIDPSKAGPSVGPGGRDPEKSAEAPFTPPPGAVHHRVRVLGSNGVANDGDVYIQAWDPRDRLLRALKLGAGCFGFAVVSVFIPLLHFILVPAFLIATPIVAYRAYQMQAVALGGASRCPKCSAPLVIVRQKLEWPLKDVCARCYENVKIEDLGISNGSA